MEKITVTIRKVRKAERANETRTSKTSVKNAQEMPKAEPTMTPNLIAEMQKAVASSMKSDMMDTARFLMSNAVIKDGKLYTPVSDTCIGWYDPSTGMGWCDSEGYRKLVIEAEQMKAIDKANKANADAWGYTCECECEYKPDDESESCDQDCEHCDDYRACTGLD